MRQGVFGHFNQAIVRHIRNRDASLGSRGNVDVVQADAQPRDDPAPGRGRDRGRWHADPIGHDGVDVRGLPGQRVGVGRRGDD